MSIVIIHTPELNAQQQDAIEQQLGGRCEARQGYYRVQSETVAREQIQSLCQQYAFDINLLPEGFRPEQVRLVISDMDSTFINIECIDEIADFAGLKQEVAAVTEAAMRGELDFADSLTQRVGLLKGLDEGVLLKVYEERLRLNPGGEAMLKALQQVGIKFALVSGGFHFFTDRLQQRYQLDFVRANTLAIKDHKLTGEVVGEIVGGEVKREFLLQLCRELAIEPTQVVAMGDGANDLLMMQEAGLSIAYHAKPKVQQATHVSLNHAGLDAVAHLLEL